MNRPRRDVRRFARRLKIQWRRLTRGTTRAAGVGMCLTLLCAVVVGSSHVMPFAHVRFETPLSDDEAAGAEASMTGASGFTGRQLNAADYNQTWMQVSTEWNRRGDVPRRHQVLLTPDGRLSGRLSTFADWRGMSRPMTGAIVHLMRDGRVAARVSTDSEGYFAADNLTEGTYSLIAQSAQGLLAYALHVQLAATDDEALVFQLESTAATAWDDQQVLSRLFDYWDHDPPLERTREPDERTIPVSVRPITQIGAAATTLWHHHVYLQEDGRLIGRLRRLHPVTGRPIIANDVEVALYRNGTQQGLAWTDDTGYFEIPHVAPGVYSLVATGAIEDDPTPLMMPQDERGLRQGFLTFGIQVRPASELAIQQVQFATSSVLEIDAALVSLVDIQPFLGGMAAPATAPSSALFTSAGTGALGGAAGGTGGLSGLLAGGAAAGLTGLLLDDGTVSPAQP